MLGDLLLSAFLHTRVIGTLRDYRRLIDVVLTQQDWNIAGHGANQLLSRASIARCADLGSIDQYTLIILEMRINGPHKSLQSYRLAGKMLQVW